MKSLVFSILTVSTIFLPSCLKDAKKSLEVGVYTNKKANLTKSSPSLSSLTQFLGCLHISDECKTIKSINESSKALSLTLENQKQVVITKYNSKLALIKGIKSGKLDLIIGLSDWKRATELERFSPHIHLTPSAVREDITIETNLSLSDFSNLNDSLTDAFFYQQLSYKGTQEQNSIQGLISPNKITEFQATTEKSIPLSDMAKLIKLTAPFKSKNAKLFIESKEDFDKRKPELLSQNAPFIRISYQSPDSLTQGTKNLFYTLPLPLLYSSRFNDIMK
jgi:hypothetical protein